MSNWSIVNKKSLSEFISQHVNTLLPWVIAVLFLIQAIDNYFIEPDIVGEEVNLSAMATIFILIAGELLWGNSRYNFIPLHAGNMQNNF